MITQSSAEGVVGWSVEIAGGSEDMMAAIRLAWLLPVKALLPVAISYSSAPRAKMSVRASASLPSNCSGAMYWNVPRRVPSVVRGFAFVSSVESGSELGRAAPCLARPKSRSFVPDRVSITFPGLRSRWTIPWRCALSNASAISAPYLSTWSSGSGPLASRSPRVSPSTYSMTR